MAVLVEIGDDEQPAETKEKIGPLCKLAVQWCKREDFAEWLRPYYDRHMGGDGAGWGDVGPNELGGLEAWCRHAILVLTGAKSRKELDTNLVAAQEFKRIREMFMRDFYG